MPDNARINEDIQPGSTDVVAYVPPKTSEEVENDVRRGLAYGVISVLCLLYGAVIVSFLFFDLTIEKLTAAIAALSGLQGIAAIVLGFYFARQLRHKARK